MPPQTHLLKNEVTNGGVIENLIEQISSAIYDANSNVVDQISVSVDGGPYSVALRYDPSSGSLFLEDFNLMEEAPEHFNTEFDPETKIVLLHSVQVEERFIHAKLKFEGDSFSILESYRSRKAGGLTVVSSPKGCHG